MALVGRSYAIIGTGALGGYYGALLQRSGLDVHFLVHSDYEHVARHGLRVESKFGDFDLPRVRAYPRVEEMPRCDVVVVALKTTQNHLLPKLLPPVVKKDGVVLTLQNGLGVEEEVAAVIGGERVLGGLCFLCSNKVGPGHIRHLDYGKITMGEWVGGGPETGDEGRESGRLSCPRSPVSRRPSSDARPRSSVLHRIAEEFQRAGIEVEPAEDLLLGRWKKLVWNVPFNGLSVLLDTPTDALVRDPHALELVRALMDEVVAGAAAYGRQIPPEFVEHMLDLTRNMVPYRPSMKIDYDERRPMEVEAIFGSPVRAARRAGVDLPLMRGLSLSLKFLDARNREG